MACIISLNKTFFDGVIEKGVNTLDTVDSTNIISTKEVTNNVSIDFEIEDLNNYDVLEENTKELQELDLDLKLDTLEPLTLKKPNQVYFDLYKEARRLELLLIKFYSFNTYRIYRHNKRYTSYC